MVTCRSDPAGTNAPSGPDPPRGSRKDGQPRKRPNRNRVTYLRKHKRKRAQEDQAKASSAKQQKANKAPSSPTRSETSNDETDDANTALTDESESTDDEHMSQDPQGGHHKAETVPSINFVEIIVISDDDYEELDNSDSE
ncbi:hypothetical protein K470DRAFT_272627 [Piedraia hortae CBS 480.64]|uniref:Uncharacterized protein n=1 Tax=Piedraia hortae CBS 480.64 TaxID=1314780 RepID=A0A6A7BSC1_9PEZI|nr:hypothetical protein K470DRAFT_272627 [Piedraia hortae CBS 480.64]